MAFTADARGNDCGAYPAPTIRSFSEGRVHLANGEVIEVAITRDDAKPPPRSAAEIWEEAMRKREAERKT